MGDIRRPALDSNEFASGGADAWDNDAGVIVAAEFFAELEAIYKGAAGQAVVYRGATPVAQVYLGRKKLFP